MTPLHRIHIPPQTGTGFELRKGQVLRITDPTGEQVSDLMAFSKHDPKKVLSSGRSIDYANTIYLTTGHTLYSNDSEPMFTILEDKVGRHDFLLTPCSQETFSIIYKNDAPHPSCFGNLVKNLEQFGIEPHQIPTTFNVFMNVMVDPEKGELTIGPPRSKAGDYTEFRAEMDMFVGVTACSAEMSNNYSFKPIDVANDGRTSKGPAGYREASCATVSFCDGKGDLIGAIRIARAPEAKKATLKKMLAAEVSAVPLARPNLKVVKVADGALDNWDYLSSSALPAGEEAVDFYHASEHLHDAIANVHGDGTHETRFRHATLRETLRDDDGGIDKVIRALKHLATTHPQKKIVARELAYFRKNRKRMCYSALKAKGLMIGSGVVEAACKTLVTQRLKQSGMRWSVRGAQAILTPRGWDQSERFDNAWALIAATFQADITVLANVIAFKPVATPRKPRPKASR